MILFKKTQLNILFFMKPQLVDYNEFFKKKKTNIENPTILENKIVTNQTDNIYFFFNIISIIIIIFIILFLYFRKENKDKKKRLQIQKIIQFYHDTNKFEK